MSFCRLSSLAVVGLVAALGLGCQTPPTRIEPPVTTDTFGFAREDITPETVGREQMLRQRAQIELKFAGAFPFDLFNPAEDPLTDPGLAVGTKFSFEVEKNLFLSGSFDWVRHDVDESSDPALNQPVQFMELYDRYTFLGGLDYDIPIGTEEVPMLLRVGGAVGLLVIQPTDRRAGTLEVETFLNFVARPSVGLRFPVHENWIVFVEGSLDLTASRTLRTVNDNRIDGSDPVFGNGMIWVGAAFQWH